MALFSRVLLISDFDRTLTAPDGSIPQRNLEAIRYFIDNGGTFTLASGRTVAMARRFLADVPANAPFILCNGGVLWDGKQVLDAVSIDLELWQTMTAVQQAFPDLICEVEGIDAHYILTGKDELWEAFCDANDCPRGYAAADTDMGPFVKFCVYGPLHETTITHLFSATPEEKARMDAAEAQLKAMFADKISVFRSGARMIDCQAKEVSKLRAARDLQKRLGKDILVCVGDAENDTAMLRGADYSYCPADGAIANAFENVCPCTDGAVADVIYRKIPVIL